MGRNPPEPETNSPERKSRVSRGLKSAQALEENSGPSRIRTWDQSVMSAGAGPSAAYQGGPQSAKLSETHGTSATRSVHGVPPGPTKAGRFVSHLVPSEPMGSLLTVRKLAERWKVCTATVYALAKAGKISALRIGNSVRFRAADVLAYEGSRQGVPTER